jgi:hypothetical protein
VGLTNHGVGTAVIRKVTFRRGKRTATNAADLLELKRDVVWDDFTDYKSGPFYLPSKETETLVELSLEGLIDQDIPEDKAVDLMGQLETQLDEIDVVLTYEDVLGNVIAEYEVLG